MLNQVLVESSPSWADGAAAGTKQYVEVLTPHPTASGDTVIIVNNPSQDTALTVQPQTKTSFNGGPMKYPNLGDGLLVGIGESRAFLVKGWPLDQGGRLAISNVSALPQVDDGTGTGTLVPAGGFAANVKVIAL